MECSLQDLKNYLLKYNIKPSTIRIKILEYLLHNRIHPTVEDIYLALLDQIPTLSKTSVYNTIELFLSSGLLNEVITNDNELRVDIDTSLHGHFKCSECGKIYDFYVKEPEILGNNLFGFEIEQKNIFYKGVCNNCKIKKN